VAILFDLGYNTALPMKPKAWLALIAVYIVWGSTYLAIRFVVESIPPFFSAAARFLVSGAILYVWMRLAGSPAPTRRQWTSAAVVGLFLLMGGNGSVVWAEQRIPSGVASLFIGATPLWMVLIDALRPGGRNPGWLIWTGVLVGFGGVALLAAPWESGSAGSLEPLGSAALLFAALSWSIGSLYSRSAPLPEAPLMATGAEMLMGSLGLFVASGLTGEWGQLNLAAVTPRAWWGLAYLISFGSLVGFVAYTWLLRNAPTPIVATYAYVNPVVAILMGSLLGQETITPRMLVSAVIIIGAVVLINLAKVFSGRAPEQQKTRA
jgi:drug/metabolite transporter (DMT)-like permease